MKRPSPTARIVLMLLGNTVLLFAVYILGVSVNAFVTFICYTVVTAAFAFSYVIYNRGFSRRGVKLEMLPQEWSPEKKTEFIEDGKRRFEKSKWMLTVIFPLIAIYGYELFDIYILPAFKNLFS